MGAFDPVARRVAKLFYRRLPTIFAAALDFYLRPQLKRPWGGPFNGQRIRQKIVEDILSLIDFDCVIETGTFRGSTTLFFASKFDGPIFTCELNHKFFLYSKKRLRLHPKIFISELSSVKFLQWYFASTRFRDKATFFYLDSHWQDHLPLREELELIHEFSSHFVAMVDDFQVVDDPGYGYDDYGPGRALNLDYLEFLRNRDSHLFYPATPSEQESGARKGCIIIASNRHLMGRLLASRCVRYLGPSRGVLGESFG